MVRWFVIQKVLVIWKITWYYGEVVGITEGATDSEDNMDIDGEAVGNTQGSSDTEDIIDIDGDDG